MINQLKSISALASVCLLLAAVSVYTTTANIVPNSANLFTTVCVPGNNIELFCGKKVGDTTANKYGRNNTPLLYGSSDTGYAYTCLKGYTIISNGTAIPAKKSAIGELYCDNFSTITCTDIATGVQCHCGGESTVCIDQWSTKIPAPLND